MDCREVKKVKGNRGLNSIKTEVLIDLKGK